MFDHIKLRKGQPDHRLSEDGFKAKFRADFYDPRFDGLRVEIEKLAEQAWQNYRDHRKSPRTVKAGVGFQDPDYDLSIEWLETCRKLQDLQAHHATAPSSILIISGSPRNEHTCPGEESKSYRMVQSAKAIVDRAGWQNEILDLSELTSEYGKKIHPCKACVSTAMPLCHWPCSCYPNHSLGQTQDWMSEIYEKWVRAHGVLIITPVHWYQAPSALKLMIDRLVCADGGNPDPSSTQGKDAKKAKKIELDGWDFPKHLEGRAFAVVTHGDAAGVENMRRILTDWLTDMKLVQAGASGVLGGYIGYYKPYATSHDELDKNQDFLKEVENATLSLIKQVEMIRAGDYKAPDAALHHPLQK